MGAWLAYPIFKKKSGGFEDESEPLCVGDPLVLVVAIFSEYLVANTVS